jgi:benzoyl-CoA-dihydrodiol lyase
LDHHTPPPFVELQTHPSQYVHWKLLIDGSIARLVMDVQEDRALSPDYKLKLNSYDLSVDIELCDAIQRLRFEHPEVRCLIFSSAIPRCFCSGANIMMLRSSAHAFKVNFCKFTNETRLSLEDASARSGLRSIAAISGACAGGGYELALACDEILLIDDGSSTVSLPEVPLLAVLPGTGGLTRLVDKRKVRRDLADIFCTTAEGIKGRRALEWRLVDHVAPSSRFSAALDALSQKVVADSPARATAGVTLNPLSITRDGDTSTYSSLTLQVNTDARTATITVLPPPPTPADAAAALAQGDQFWPLRLFRDLDHALLDLRFNAPSLGLTLLKSKGDPAVVLAYDQLLDQNKDAWFIAETIGLIARTLKRLDVSARSFFTLVEPGSMFSGTLLELALAADRSYALLDPDDDSLSVTLSAMNAGPYPMGNGLTRLASRFYGEPQTLDKLTALTGETLDIERATKLGLFTAALDDIDWEDEIPVLLAERASFSPDALTGMEASLRFPGPETLETKIFGRLSAWQNWIFQRPNAVGPQGALQCFGQPERPEFDFSRV